MEAERRGFQRNVTPLGLRRTALKSHPTQAIGGHSPKSTSFPASLQCDVKTFKCFTPKDQSQKQSQLLFILRTMRDSMTLSFLQTSFTHNLLILKRSIFFKCQQHFCPKSPCLMSHLRLHLQHLQFAPASIPVLHGTLQCLSLFTGEDTQASSCLLSSHTTAPLLFKDLGTYQLN